jgi:hypothetical protein
MAYFGCRCLPFESFLTVGWAWLGMMLTEWPERSGNNMRTVVNDLCLSTVTINLRLRERFQPNMSGLFRVRHTYNLTSDCSFVRWSILKSGTVKLKSPEYSVVVTQRVESRV